MSSYSQLSIVERCSIARLREAGQSIRQIAATLDRQPSTIARELKRNSGSQVGYRPSYAQAQTDARRWTGSRLERDDALRETILDRLAEGWSPEQIAGRLARNAGQKIISHETIYRFVYAQLKRTNDRRWRFYLPRAKYKRGWRTKGGWPRQTDKCSIHDRPPDIATRQQAGHWEADAMLFSIPGQAILIAHERRSRLTIALRQKSLKADPVAAALIRMLGVVPPVLRRSITFDNPVLSLSKGEPSSPAISASQGNSASRPSSAIPGRHGRRAASKTPSDDCAANCRERPISMTCPAQASMPSSQTTTTHPGNASAS